MAGKRQASLELHASHGRAKRQHTLRTSHIWSKEEYGSPSFLGLPPSVRGKIHHYLLDSTESCFYVVNPGKLRSSQWCDGHELAPSLGLFRACRSINVETSEILYGQLIHFYGHDLLGSWLENIGANNRSRVKHLKCYFVKQCSHSPGSPHLQDVTFYLNCLLRAPRSEFTFLVSHEFESWCSERFPSCTRKVSMKRMSSALQTLSQEDFIQECGRQNIIQALLLDSQGATAILKYRTASPEVVLEQKFELQGGGPKNKTMRVVNTHPVAEVPFYRLRGFFDLPHDLIRRIIEQVIGPPRSFEVAIVRNAGEENQPSSIPHLTTNLYSSLPRTLWTCKRMRDLALRLFYTQNTFTFHYHFTTPTVSKPDFDLVLQWLHQTPHRHHAHQIRVDLDFGPAISLPSIRISLHDFLAPPTHTRTRSVPPLNVTCRFIAGGAMQDIHMDAIERNMAKLRYKNFCMDDDIENFCGQEHGRCMENGSYPKKEVREICRRERYPAGCLVDGYGEARSFFVWGDAVVHGRVERVMRDYEFPERRGEEPSTRERRVVEVDRKMSSSWRPWESA